MRLAIVYTCDITRKMTQEKCDEDMPEIDNNTARNAEK